MQPTSSFGHFTCKLQREFIHPPCLTVDILQTFDLSSHKLLPSVHQAGASPSCSGTWPGSRASAALWLGTEGGCAPNTGCSQTSPSAGLCLASVPQRGRHHALTNSQKSALVD